MHMEPEDWLAELDHGTLNAPLAHPRIGDFAERVAKRTTELRLQQANNEKRQEGSVVSKEDRSLPQSS
jgi:hypothetical protein